MCLHLMRTVDRELKKTSFFFSSLPPPPLSFHTRRKRFWHPVTNKNTRNKKVVARETRGGRVEERQNDLQMNDKHSCITPASASDTTKGPVSQVLLQIFNLARQMEQFLNPLAVSHMFVFGKGPWKVFGKRGGQTFMVISRTFCLMHSSGPIRSSRAVSGCSDRCVIRRHWACLWKTQRFLETPPRSRRPRSTQTFGRRSPRHAAIASRVLQQPQQTPNLPISYVRHRSPMHKNLPALIALLDSASI